MINLIADHGRAIEVQRKLRSLGFYADELDGLFGPASQEALKAWRSSQAHINIWDEEWQLLQIQTRLRWPGGRSKFTSFYGAFEFKSDPSGLVQVLDDWSAHNLVVRDLPFFGRLWVHKKVALSLHVIGRSIESMPVEYPIRLVGCYNPRHKGYNPRRTLSSHAFAAAIDLNWDTNGYGTVGDLPPDIVNAFQSEGWTWGGDWGGLQWSSENQAWVANPERLGRSDPMHFQAGRDW